MQLVTMMEMTAQIVIVMVLVGLVVANPNHVNLGMVIVIMTVIVLMDYFVETTIVVLNFQRDMIVVILK